MKSDSPASMKRLKLAAVGALTAATVIGLLGLADRFANGIGVANFTSISPWGIWMSMYIYFIGLSAGSFLLSSLVYVFGVKKFEPVGRIALFQALVCLIAGLSLVFVDVGRPERIFRVLWNWSESSVLAWEVLFYQVYIVVLCLELWILMRRDLERLAHEAKNPLLRYVYRILSIGRPYTPGESQSAGEKRMVRILAIAGVPVALGVHGGTGLIFAVLKAHPYWYTGMFPIIFIVSAMASGGALLTFLTVFFTRLDAEVKKTLVPALARLTAIILLADMFLLALETFLAIYGNMPDHTLTFEAIFAGPYWWVFWFFEFGLGTVAPVTLILSKWTRGNVRVLGAASAMIFIGVIGVRLNIVIPPLQISWAGGLVETFHRTLNTSAGYTPSFNEWMSTVGVIAIGAWAGLAGFRILPLGLSGDGKEKES